MADDTNPVAADTGAPPTNTPPAGFDFAAAQAMLRNKYQDDPVQTRASLDALESQYTGAKVGAGTQKILQQGNLDTAIDQFSAALRSGIDTPEKGQALIDQIGSNPDFAANPAARSDAYLALRNHVTAAATGAASSGPGTQFTRALGQFANGQPVTKTDQLSMLAQGALTPEGYGTLSTLTADPTEARLINAKLIAARAQLSSGSDDAEGESIFTDHFLPTLLSLYQARRAQGKAPLDLLASDSNDEITQPLIGIFGGMRGVSPGGQPSPGPSTLASSSEPSGAPQGAAPPLSPDAADSDHDLPADKGAEIVAAAVQWNGTPYAPETDKTYRGSGATRGQKADCSGSVWKIYGDAGLKYSYQDTASFAAAAQNGKIPFRRIDPKDLRPGDLILYPPSLEQHGHMSIYAGGDMVWSAHKNPLPFAQFRIGTFGRFQAYRYVPR